MPHEGQSFSGLSGFQRGLLGLTQQNPGPAEIPFHREHVGVDPETGLLTGFSGTVPAQFGLMYQDIHTQATARARQAMMSRGLRAGRAGLGFQEGALGLLQSFRPGGGAQAAAAAYGQLGQMQFQQAGLHFQRALMTQPIDYLADWRRHERFENRRRARDAQQRASLSSIPIIGPILGGFL